MILNYESSFVLSRHLFWCKFDMKPKCVQSCLIRDMCWFTQTSLEQTATCFTEMAQAHSILLLQNFSTCLKPFPPRSSTNYMLLCVSEASYCLVDSVSRSGPELSCTEHHPASHSTIWNPIQQIAWTLKQLQFLLFQYIRHCHVLLYHIFTVRIICCIK